MCEKGVQWAQTLTHQVETPPNLQWWPHRVLLDTRLHRSGSSEPPLLGTHSSLGATSGEEEDASVCPRALLCWPGQPWTALQRGRAGEPMLGTATQTGKPQGEFRHSTASGKLHTHTRLQSLREHEAHPGDHLCLPHSWNRWWGVLGREGETPRPL